MPLNSLYIPEHNKTGTTSIVKGLAASTASGAASSLPTTRSAAPACLARRTICSAALTLPSVCAFPDLPAGVSYVELDKQEKVYPNRRGAALSTATPN